MLERASFCAHLFHPPDIRCPDGSIPWKTVQVLPCSGDTAQIAATRDTLCCAALRSDHDHGDLPVEDPGELGGHDGLGLHDTLLALGEALELCEQTADVLLRLLGLGRQSLQLRYLPVLHQELHDVHIVLHFTRQTNTRQCARAPM